MKVAVVGGGAAGCVAAIAAARAGNEVDLYEQNEKLGKKLFLTGKGRCNLTNAAEMKTVLEHVVTNPRFLYSAFQRFTNEDIIALVEAEGCPTKTERGDRVFPVSDHSYDVIDALKKALKKAGVRVHLNHRVGNLSELSADRIIVATGGLSYPSTGSTGDGYRWARELGHTVVEPVPALVPLRTKENCAPMMGLSLRNVRAAVWDGEKCLFDEFGEMLFTHFGVSGPLMLSASSYITRLLREKELQLTIDLKPALEAEKLDERILRDFEKNRNKNFENALHELLPAGLIPEVIRQSGIDPHRKVHDITRQERAALGNAVKQLRFTLVGTEGFSGAVITQGGISVKEIHPGTMESKLAPGVYFAGEVLDLDARTGGYNLQIAWSTGWCAGTGE